MMALHRLKHPMSRRPLYALLSLLALTAGYLAWPGLSFRWQAAQAAPAPDYHAVIDARPVAGIRNNLSGLSYRADTGTLLAVVNRPAELLELSTDGTLLARYRLSGVSDPEGVAWLGDDTLVIVGEAKSRLHLFRLQAGRLRREQVLQLPARGGWLRNAGLEGLAWDPVQQHLLLVQEKLPRRLSTLDRDADGRLQSDCQDCRQQRLLRHLPLDGLRDLSSLEMEADGRHLWLLSDASRQLVRFNLETGARERLFLRAGQLGLSADIPQAEGFTVDRDGNLYIVSEPNLFYRFRRG